MSSNRLRSSMAAMIVLFCAFAHAGEWPTRARDLERLIEDNGIYVQSGRPAVRLGGWVEAGYSYGLNGGGSDGGISGTPAENVVTGDDSNDFNLNAVRLILEKPLSDENTWAAGFRLDIAIGEDYRWGLDNEPGLGNGDGAINFEAAYVALRVPVGRGIDLMIGKWPSPIGYEASDRAENDNVTFGAVGTYLEAGFHTGILALAPVTDHLTVMAGICNGWANSDTDFLDAASPSDWAKTLIAGFELQNAAGNASMIAAASWTPEGDSFAANVSNGWRNGTADGGDFGRSENSHIFALSVNGEWEPIAFGGRLKLAFCVDIDWAQDNLSRASSDWAGGGVNGATAWGAAAYGRYQFNDRFYVATRGEYLHSDDGTLGFVDGIVPWPNDNASLDGNEVYTSHVDLYTFTITFGFEPADGLLLRLEYRADFASSDGGDDGEGNIFGNNQSGQHALCVDAVYSFW